MIATDHPAALAWAAGVIEGEGWIGLRRGHSPGIRVAMADEDVVRRLHEVTGVGTFGGPYDRTKYGPDRKPMWLWQVQDTAEARHLMIRLRPFMGARRTAAIDHVFETNNKWLNKQGRPMTHRVEYVVGYEVESEGEIEDIEGRLKSTSPDTMDLVSESEVDVLPEAA